MDEVTIHTLRFGILSIWMLVLSCHYESKPDPSIRDRIRSILFGIGSIGFLALLIFAT